MKTLTLLVLLLALAPKARAFSDYQALHDAAHFGAGVLIGTAVQTFTQFSGMQKAHPTISQLLVYGVVIFAATAKESDDAVWNWEQWTSTVLGGRLALQVRW